ncbi:endonuclease/exonuclease/phosphatase (EEP) superfamily protein YafD [Mycolicibacterium iranicum]|uniref:Endonuclease/exonuclease/phosphatase (EEP) superfamily protein YafD n=1 Tax=Mycolicibacterium iranicum TaxID=912594 RepID=A0A839Q457_MYCIR|nr:endonuclease/exonuclease/phosphatase family protein [Mycolicibacterium iranicum]MBB2990457.1 endonuclease/exonuclease/phosphatase (EEP) superfamily protein YafD [Mycolicibacterium iranicum]
MTAGPTLRTVCGVVGTCSAAAAALGVAAHFAGPVSTTVALTASFTPLFVILAGVSAVLLVAARWRRAAIAVLVVVLVGVGSQLPLFIGESPESGVAPTITVLQANIRLGEADPHALVDLVRGGGVEVLTVSELTEPAVAKLAAAGVGRALPFSYLYPRRGGGGAGIYSRHPLTDTRELPGLQHTNLRASLRVPGAAPVAVYALHPLPPYPEPSWRWALELERIGAVLAAEPQPIVVGADVNSTYDHQRYRALLRESTRDGEDLVDAAEHLGAGIVATYPADRWFPAVLAIDKILARGAVPVSLRRVELPGSDHHGVMGEVRLPPAPS